MTDQEELKRLFNYNPRTGLFIRKISRGNTKKGDVAGSPDSKGYLRILLNGKREKVHRLAFLYMTGKRPEGVIDHINGKKTDNRWKNLRDVTNEVNTSNRQRANSTNALGVLGVHRQGNKYRAKFKGRCLGLHTTVKEAAAAYQSARSTFFES